MNRRLHPRYTLAAAGLGLALSFAAGCDYSIPDMDSGPRGRTTLGAMPTKKGSGTTPAAKSVASRRSPEERKAILDSIITLIERASVKPGGEHYAQAVKKLNQYFDESTDPARYQLESAARDYLAAQLGPGAINQLQARDWTDRDTRHIEDCMMYYKIANRVAGTGDDLTRARRLFDWIMRQVELVPAGSFGQGSRMGPPFARPYDVLLRGMATEAEGTAWAERAWLFMALCRQIDIDTGLIAYTKGNTVDAILSEKALATSRLSQKPRVVWLCATLIGDQVYLFDTRLGLEVPGPGGQGVATLEQALADPSILERLNLPGLAPYPASRAALLSSPTKIGILIDSSPGYFAPKMKMLQGELSGKYRTILFNDPAAQRDHFVRALGPRAGAILLWDVPLQVQARLFSDSEYVASIQYSLFWFKPEFPLIYARVKQLRGELPEAIEEYVAFRKGRNLPLVTEQKAVPKERQQTIPKEVQDGLDVYASYYLALSHLENNNLKQAEDMFRQVLSAVPPPEPGKQQPYYQLFRWGANANLARIQESKHDDQAAIDYYTQYDPTSQGAGNLLRARELVWRNPLR